LKFNVGTALGQSPFSLFFNKNFEFDYFPFFMIK